MCRRILIAFATVVFALSTVTLVENQSSVAAVTQSEKKSEINNSTNRAVRNLTDLQHIKKIQQKNKPEIPWAFLSNLLKFFDTLAFNRDRILANNGDCYAIERIILRVDPGNVNTWLDIIWHESSRGMWGLCGPRAANPISSARGLTQQIQSYHAGRYRNFAGCYDSQVGALWWDVYCHMLVSDSMKDSRGNFGDWAGAIGYHTPKP